MEALRLTLGHRPLRTADLAEICNWVENPAESQFCFPGVRWPLAPDGLSRALLGFSSGTLILRRGEAVAFADFRRAEVHGACVLGHFLVAPEMRGLGVGRHLIEIMREQARSRYHAREFRVSCHNANVAGLQFFPRFGLEPCGVEPYADPEGQPAVLIHFRQPLLPAPRF